MNSFVPPCSGYQSGYRAGRLARTTAGVNRGRWQGLAAGVLVGFGLYALLDVLLACFGG
jgi:hypothetical protein